MAERGGTLYLVHGDEETALAFAQTMRERGVRRVEVPEAYATYRLERRA
jgi:hypothetical protein